MLAAPAASLSHELMASGLAVAPPGRSSEEDTPVYWQTVQAIASAVHRILAPDRTRIRQAESCDLEGVAAYPGRCTGPGPHGAAALAALR